MNKSACCLIVHKVTNYTVETSVLKSIKLNTNVHAEPHFEPEPHFGSAHFENCLLQNHFDRSPPESWKATGRWWLALEEVMSLSVSISPGILSVARPQASCLLQYRKTIWRNRATVVGVPTAHILFSKSRITLSSGDHYSYAQLWNWGWLPLICPLHSERFTEECWPRLGFHFIH